MRRFARASAPAAVAAWSPPAWGLDASAGRHGESDAARATGHPGGVAWLARAAGLLAAIGPAVAGAISAVSAALRPGGGSGWGKTAPRGGASCPTSPGLAAMLRSRRVRRLARDGVTR